MFRRIQGEVKELSLKQREMLNAYNLELSTRNWPKLRARPTPIIAIKIHSEPNTPDNSPKCGAS